MLPPPYDSGSKPVTWQQNPSFSFTAFKKASKSRIQELLKVVNWMSAPFGSSEFLQKTYGVEGVDWVRKNGDIAQTQAGINQASGLSIGYVGSGPDVLYAPGVPQATQDCYAFMKKSIPMSVADPTTGLYSRTNGQKSTVLTGIILNAAQAIIQGQQPLSSWSAAVKSWQTSGGNQVRTEFEEALGGSK